MYLASKGVIPPEQYNHDKNFKDKDKKTVQDYLIENNIEVPQQWQIQSPSNTNNTKESIDTKCSTSMSSVVQQSSQQNQTQQQQMKQCFDQQIKDQLKDYCQKYNIDESIIIDNPGWQRNQYKQTFAMYLSEQGIVPPEQLNHDPQLIDNQYKRTVAMNLSGNQEIPPQQWQHDKYLKDEYGKTVHDYLKQYNIIVPEQWNTDIKIQMTEEIELKLKEYCDIYQIQDQQQIINYPDYQNNRGDLTFAMYLAQNKIIPPVEFNHKQDIQDENKYTVAIYLAFNSIIPPTRWKHEQKLQNNDGFTVAMCLASKGIIPQLQWQHDPLIVNKYGETVAMLLANNGIEPPKEWSHDKDIKDNTGNTVAMYLAKNGKIIPKEWNHDPELQNKDNFTVALILAKNKIIPPEKWQHDKFLQDKDGYTVYDYLKRENINVPKEWNTNKQIQMTDEIKYQLEQYCEEYKIEDQQIIINNPEYQKDNYADTFALWLQKQNIEVPEDFLYNSEHKLLNSSTTAMMISSYGSIPSQIWKHDASLQNNYKFTVAMNLASMGTIPSEEWKHDPELQSSNGNTVAMWLAQNGIIPPELWNHKPELQNNEGNTVAMLLIDRNKDIEIPEQWFYDLNIKNNYDQDIVFKLANNGRIPQQKWYIDPTFIYKYGYDNIYVERTIAHILASKGIIPPKECLHDPKLKDNINKTVEDYLKENNKKVPDHWKTIQLNDEQEKQLNIFCKKYKVSKQFIIDNPEWQDNEQEETFALYAANNGIQVPIEFQHDPKLEDKNGNTVAVYLEINNIKTPKEWQYGAKYRLRDGMTTAMKITYCGKEYSKHWTHFPVLDDGKYGFTLQDYINANKQDDQCEILKQLIEYCIKYNRTKQFINSNINWQDNQENKTFAMFLAENYLLVNKKKIKIPEQYIHDPCLKDKNNNTVAILLAMNGVIPQKEWYHDPTIENNDNNTVAVYLERNGVKTPKYWQYNPLYRLGEEKFTTAMKTAQEGQIPSSYWQHSPRLQNKNGNTVAVLLEIKGVDTPKQWKYNSEYRLQDGFTTEIKIASYGVECSDQWKIKINTQNEYGFTIRDYLIINNKKSQKQNILSIEPKHRNMLEQLNKYCKQNKIDKDQILNNYSWQNKKYGGKISQTFAMYLAQQGNILYEEFQHEPTLQDNDGNTVAIYLEKNKIEVPQQWRYDPEYKLQDNMTTSMKIACNNIIPSKIWEHNPYIPNNQEKTVQDYLIENNIEVPDQWKVNNKQIEMTDQIKQYLKEYCKIYDIKNQQIIINYPQYQKQNNYDTFAMFLALNREKPPKEFCHDPEIINNKRTVALLLAQNKIIPQEEWQHDPNITDICGFTVQDYLISNNKEVPEFWKVQDNIIQDKVTKHLVEYCNKYKINKQNIINNPGWNSNEDKYTFAMYLVCNGIIPPKQFIHDPNIKGQFEYCTVRWYLQHNSLPIPNEWYDNEYKKNHEYKPNYVNDTIYGIQTSKPYNVNPETQYDNGQTIAMIYAKQGIIPPKCWEHDPMMQDNQRNTVAYYLEVNEIETPEQWRYYPEYRLQDKMTTAMRVASQGKIPSEHWEHDQYLVDLKKQTVALIYANQNIIPPQYWNHDSDIVDIYGKSVQDYLILNNTQVPLQWKKENTLIQNPDKIEQYLKEFCKEYKIENEQLIKNNPQYQKLKEDNGNFTFAIWLASKGIIPPEQFKHNPQLQISGWTVALQLATKGIIAPEQWNHDSKLKSSAGKTVQEYLRQQKEKVPSQWSY